MKKLYCKKIRGSEQLVHGKDTKTELLNSANKKKTKKRKHFEENILQQCKNGKTQ